MGFLIPSLEQYRYIRRFKRQRRLEQEEAPERTSQNACNDAGDEGSGSSTLKDNKPVAHSSPNKDNILSSSHAKRRRARKRRRHDDDMSADSESVAASHISDLLGESQQLAADGVDVNGPMSVTVNTNAGPVADASHHANLQQPQEEEQNHTQSSSATELPPVNERMKMPRVSSGKNNATEELPSKPASQAAAAAAKYLASQDPAPDAKPTAALERHTSRTTSYADSGMTLSVPPEQQQRGAPKRHNSHDDEATEFGEQPPSSFVITSPVRQPESQGTVSPIQSPVEAIERYQREQYEVQRRRRQTQKETEQQAAMMIQQPLVFPQQQQKQRSSYSSSGGSSKPWFQKKKRKPKMSQTTLSFRSGSN